MSASENLRLQHLFEDGMATLTTSVETLSHQLSEELGLLRARVDDVIHPRDGEGNAAPSSSSVRSPLRPGPYALSSGVCIRLLV